MIKDSRLLGPGAGALRPRMPGPAGHRTPVPRPPARVLAAALAAIAPGCSPTANLPALPVAPPGLETGAIAGEPAAEGPIEMATLVPGTPTDVYTIVAGSALRCWLGAGGPLKATHVFHAEAAPPTEGGGAEIVLHERDPLQRDQRGARAFRVSFTGEGGSVRVGITTIRIAAPLAELMVRDVSTWAGGGAGCQARALSPPTPQAAAPPQPLGKAKGSRSSQR